MLGTMPTPFRAAAFADGAQRSQYAILQRELVEEHATLRELEAVLTDISGAASAASSTKPSVVRGMALVMACCGKESHLCCHWAQVSLVWSERHGAFSATSHARVSALATMPCWGSPTQHDHCAL
jgi:hypothetical protein